LGGNFGFLGILGWEDISICGEFDWYKDVGRMWMFLLLD
jgi:hypothetical protein